MTITPDRIERLFERLEETAISLAHVAGDLKLVAERQETASIAMTSLQRATEENRASISRLRSDLDKWVNRGWGAWGVVFLLFTIVTAVDWGWARGILGQPPAQHVQPPAPSVPITGR